MNSFHFLKFTAIIVANVFFFYGKNENSNEHKSKPVYRHQLIKISYRDSFEIWSSFIADPDNGWTPGTPSPGWFPGKGTGNSILMGVCSTYFNRYVTSDSNRLIATADPVTMFFNTQLQQFKIPAYVNTVVLDTNGNVIWFRLTESHQKPVSATRVDLSGESDIVGGNGKFKGATGHTKFTGVFNPQTQHSSIVRDGWIEY
jgi:hypothetical protein